MKPASPLFSTGMTLVEILIALAIASLMTLTGWRALDTLQVSRDRVVSDATQWQRLDEFFGNLEADLRRASLSEFSGTDGSLSMLQPSLTRGLDSRRVTYRWLPVNNHVEIVREVAGDRLPVAEVQAVWVSYGAETGAFDSSASTYPRAIRVRVIPLAAADAASGGQMPVERLLALR